MFSLSYLLCISTFLLDIVDEIEFQMLIRVFLLNKFQNPVISHGIPR